MSFTLCGYVYFAVGRTNVGHGPYMTVRKERRQRGGCYWVAYRRTGGQLHNVYLGRSAQLTRDRLSQAVAHVQGASDVHGSAGVGQK